MLKQFSTLKPSIINNNTDIDNDVYCWTLRPSAFCLPVIALYAEKLYKISDFDSTESYCIAVEAESPAHILQISMDIYGGDIKFSEWMAVYQLCMQLGVSFAELDIPQNVKKHGYILATATRWPQDFIKYLDEKPIQWRTLHLVSLMSIEHIAYITDFVRAERPSAQGFKIFIEKLRDFSSDIMGGVYNKAEFEVLTERRTALHKCIDELMTDIRSAVDVKNSDNFETNCLYWSFTTHNTLDFLSALKKLNDVAKNVEKLYKKLEDE
jgi:hypothetical protein